MSKAFAVLIVLLVIIGGVWFTVKDGQKNPGLSQPVVPPAPKLRPLNFFSTAFKTGESIPVKYTCAGENMSLGFRIENVSPEIKSLAIIVDDPDAPKGDWVHLVMWNINPSVTEIAENVLPKSAVVGVNDFGQNNYGGPCPASGQHRYFFKLFALDTKLTLTSFSGKTELLKAMEGHVVIQKDFFGVFNK